MHVLKSLLKPFLFAGSWVVWICRMATSPIKKQAEARSKSETFLPILICAIAIPLSMLMWIGNLAFSFFTSNYDRFGREDISVIPPTRWLAATITPLVISMWGLRKKSLVMSGALLGLFVGFILTLTSYAFLACLLTFFVTSSKATKFRGHLKNKFEENFKEGGQRNWTQVLCNGGMATQLALLYLLDVGCGERPVDFTRDYRSSWLGLGVLGAFACCNGDTWASELGSVVGGSDPLLITTLKRVPRGTNGGVSIPGLVFSLLGGAMVGAAHYLTVLYTVDPTLLALSPPQWPLVVAGGFAGLVGSLVDSLLGATLQFSGVSERTGCVLSVPGKGVRHVSGLRLLDNDSVNLISSIVTGLVVPHLANLLWP